MERLLRKVSPSRLVDARKRAGIKPIRVAERLGISRARLWNYENGVCRVPADYLCALAEIYERPVQFFLE